MRFISMERFLCSIVLLWICCAGWKSYGGATETSGVALRRAVSPRSMAVTPLAENLEEVLEMIANLTGHVKTNYSDRSGSVLEGVSEQWNKTVGNMSVLMLLKPWLMLPEWKTENTLQVHLPRYVNRTIYLQLPSWSSMTAEIRAAKNKTGDVWTHNFTDAWEGVLQHFNSCSSNKRDGVLGNLSRIPDYAKRLKQNITEELDRVTIDIGALAVNITRHIMEKAAMLGEFRSNMTEVVEAKVTAVKSMVNMVEANATEVASKLAGNLRNITEAVWTMSGEVVKDAGGRLHEAMAKIPVNATQLWKDYLELTNNSLVLRVEDLQQIVHCALDKWANPDGVSVVNATITT